MIRTNAQLLLAGKEANLGVDPTLTPEANAISADKLLPRYDPGAIKRLRVESGIDAAKNLIGRETLGFDIVCELMGSGTVGVAPDWGELLEACGFTKSVLAVAAIDDPVAGYGNAGLTGLAVAKGGTFTGTVPRVYKIAVTTAGASGAAKVSVACRGDATQNSADNTVTTETPITLGDEGATITFTFASGSLTEGDAWYVYCYPPGIRYKPTARSETWASAFFYHYIDGVVFKGGGGRGNVTLDARAGEVASLRFEFQSVLADIDDAELPDFAFPDREPVIVEQADLHVDENNALVVENISIQSNNTISPRNSVNAPQGLLAYEIRQRDNQFSIDPEALTEAEFDFWNKLRSRKEIPISFKIGDVPGNIVHVLTRRSVFDANNLTDNEEMLRYGISGQCRPTPAGNDNIEFFLC